MKKIILVLILLSSISSLMAQNATVTMTKRNGIFYIPCKVNGLALEFIFDTGASDVTISLTEALFMLKNHYLNDDDILGASSAQLANGDITKTTTIVLKEIDIAGIKLHNINASIVNKLEAPLLLGQTAMSKLGRFQIDPNSGTLTIYKTLETSPPKGQLVESDKLKKENSDTLKAIENYTRLIMLDSKNEKAYLNRGYAKFSLKDYEGAIRDLNQVLSINPNCVEAYIKRAYAKYNLDDTQGAKNDFNAAIRANPNNAETYFKRAFTSFEKIDERIADYSKAIEINPKYVDALEWRALDRAFKKDYRGALEDYNRLTIINPRKGSYYMCRGGIKDELKDYQGAISDYTKAIEINPIDASLYNDRGDIKQKLKDYQGAIADYTKAINIDANKATDTKVFSYTSIGDIKFKLKDYQAAIKYYSKAIEIKSVSESWWYQPHWPYAKRGFVKSELGDYYGAISDLNQAIEFDPNDAGAYEYRGEYKCDLKDYQGAITDFTKAIEFDPNNADFYYNRGIAKYNSGDTQGACLDWSKAGELGYSKAYDVIRTNCK